MIEDDELLVNECAACDSLSSKERLAAKKSASKALPKMPASPSSVNASFVFGSPDPHFTFSFGVNTPTGSYNFPMPPPVNSPATPNWWAPKATSQDFQGQRPRAADIGAAASTDEGDAIFAASIGTVNIGDTPAAYDGPALASTADVAPVSNDPPSTHVPEASPGITSEANRLAADEWLEKARQKHSAGDEDGALRCCGRCLKLCKLEAAERLQRCIHEFGKGSEAAAAAERVLGARDDYAVLELSRSDLTATKVL